MAGVSQRSYEAETSKKITVWR